MQESIHLRECQQGRLVFGCFSEIHGDGHMRTAVASVVVYPLFFVAGHPGTRTLAFAGMEVSVEYSQETSVAVEHFICLYVRMIYRNFLVFLEGDAIQAGSQPKYTGFYTAQFKVRSERFFIQTEFPVFQLFRIVREVPRHQLEVLAFQFASQGTDFFYFLTGSRCISLQQVVQQLVHILAVFGHAFFQYIFSVILETQQLSQFHAEVDQLFHNLQVVEFIVVTALGVISHVERLSHFPLVTVFHKRHVAWILQSDYPAAFLPFLVCRMCGCLYGTFRKSGQFIFGVQHQFVAIGLFQVILREFQRQAAQFHAQLSESSLVFFRQIGSVADKTVV